MTRYDASKILYDIINSGIISEGLEEYLQELSNNICENRFEPCPKECVHFCDGCVELESEQMTSK
jgi:hypothetical protein